jgi:hypothetical protein
MLLEGGYRINESWTRLYLPGRQFYIPIKKNGKLFFVDFQVDGSTPESANNCNEFLFHTFTNGKFGDKRYDVPCNLPHMTRTNEAASMHLSADELFNLNDNFNNTEYINLISDE